MPPKLRADVVNVFQQALGSQYGIKVHCSGLALNVKQLFYRERNKARDMGILDYNQLKFETSPQAPDDEIWVTKTKEPTDGPS